MPVRFTRLRIAGFKSFPEATALDILPGLTGIVGPNGCGKSNVVEALRWAMGEASARSLRGGEMDDVIFAGTAHRPSRNIAEVTLRLEEAQGLAPPPFQEAAELEVSRRIERGVGSTFRVNGREARARDVQTLFADMATGARASAMVSQGRVGAIVSARPEERRSILEEAAGITGLHARRHEAELKLRATEANLARAEDTRVQLAAQLESLNRQAKQAARFRTLADSVRAAEAELLSLQRARAEAARAAARAALAEAEGAVAARVAAATRAATERAEAAAAIPPIRDEDAACRAALERARAESQHAVAAMAQTEAALRAAADRVGQVTRDLAHAEQVGRDAAAARDRLLAEEARLATEAEAAPAALADAEARAHAAGLALDAAERAAHAATEAAAEAAARARAATEAHATAGQRARRLAETLTQRRAEHARAVAATPDPHAVAEAVAAAASAERAADAARTACEAAEAARAETQSRAAAVRAAAQEAEGTRTRLAAAAHGMADALRAHAARGAGGIAEAVSVPPGLEVALGAALGEDLEAPADPAAPRHWRDLPQAAPNAAWPEGAAPLADMIGAPPALARALAGIGVIDTADEGFRLQPALAPGQTLVARDGALWRWDGFCARAGAPAPAAIRLQQRNRLAALRAELATAEQAAAAAAADRTAADRAEREAADADHAARAARAEMERALTAARERAGSLAARAASAEARAENAAQALAVAEADATEADAALAAARAALDAMPDPAAARAAAEQTRGALAHARAEAARARDARHAVSTAAEARSKRLTAVEAELAGWDERARDATSRLTHLTARRAEAEAEHRARLAAPDAAAARRDEALAAAEAAEAARRRAADRLAAAEQQDFASERALRAAETALAEAREARIRLEAEAAAADAAWGVVAERILERLGVDAALPNPPATLDDEAEERARRRLDRLAREREGLGLVNLRAEVEAAEIEARVETIASEAADLTTAIAKLRGSIGHINREGRERLGQVFADIDRHFRSLFETMFGGGRAHLALVGSDDPLQAGLEIYAQPPGKKLATLSLLSGGEQALTALSLIFAVFRCNPAPVCVLDEVDAPLDDANVERFCGLLDAMVRETGTRFLVVTHHQLTMARMDRLYGVTMQERGVSRLLSVDLGRAAELAEAPRIAAE